MRQHEVRSFPATRLYLNDVEKLWAMFTAAGLSSVSIEADGYAIADPSQLPMVGRAIKEFHLRGFDPLVDVHLEPRTVTTYCQDVNNTPGFGLFLQASELLRAHHARLAWVGPWRMNFAIIALTGVSFALNPPVLGRVVILTLQVLLVALLIWAMNRDLRAKGRVLTTSSRDRVGWLERNGDAFVVAVLAAIVGTVIGGLLVAFPGGLLKV